MRFLLALFTLISVAFAESYKVEMIDFPHYVAPEVGGLSFTPEGEIVVALRRHGVLMAKPTDDPKKFQWRVFADDILHNSCGLQVISKDEIIVSQMPELTRIKDTDGDGIADLYETISDKWGMSGNYHETNTITPDNKGGWYIAIGTASHNGPNFNNTKGTFKLNGRRGRNFSASNWKGWVLHIDKNGKTTPFASGFRANNGIGISPNNKLFVTDNQGDWRGTSPVYHVEKDKFYGHPSSLVWDEKFTKEVSDNPLFYYIKNMDKYEQDRTPAAIELPHGFMMNSPSEIVFDTKGNFGPFKGQAFIGDIAGGRIVRCMFEEVNGVTQGACVKLVDKGLRAGNNRLVFSPDGKSLYTGQTVRGWGKNSEGMQRITFNGKTPFEVQNMSLLKDGFKITFTQAINKGDAAKVSNFPMKSYFYKSTHGYGSKQYEMKSFKPKSVTVSEDGMSAILKLDNLQAGRIFELNTSCKSKNNEKVAHPQICYTINKLR
jgi:glucose/arabinose dehydrogenase